MVCESSQIPVEDDLGSDVSGYDWIGQYGAELCRDVERIHYRHLQTTTFTYAQQQPYISEVCKTTASAKQREIALSWLGLKSTLCSLGKEIFLLRYL